MRAPPPRPVWASQPASQPMIPSRTSSITDPPTYDDPASVPSEEIIATPVESQIQIDNRTENSFEFLQNPGDGGVGATQGSNTVVGQTQEKRGGTIYREIQQESVNLAQLVKQRMQNNQVAGSSKKDAGPIVKSIVNPFHISGKSDGEEVVLNNNTIFKFKRSKKKSAENKRLLSIHPVESLVMEKMMKVQPLVNYGHYLAYLGGPFSLIGPFTWIWCYQVKKVYDLAKSADKYNRRNYIDLLDKMDCQIKKLKRIMPLLLLQSAAFVIAFVFIMIKQFKKTKAAAFNAGKLDGCRKQRG